MKSVTLKTQAEYDSIVDKAERNKFKPIKNCDMRLIHQQFGKEDKEHGIRQSRAVFALIVKLFHVRLSSSGCVMTCHGFKKPIGLLLTMESLAYTLDALITKEEECFLGEFVVRLLKLKVDDYGDVVTLPGEGVNISPSSLARMLRQTVLSA
jgi:hypothetical protein